MPCVELDSLGPVCHSAEEAARIAHTWRARGWRIGFTNGCFDLLHLGHALALRYLANTCDRVMVGLNSDASVRRLKGPERPILNQDERAAALLCLRWVDAVTVFEQDTPEDLIRAIRPDVLCKGEDWRGKPVAGAAFVEQTGGRVLYHPRFCELSTTDIVRRIRERKAT